MKRCNLTLWQHRVRVYRKQRKRDLVSFDPNIFTIGRFIRELTLRSHQGYLMIRHKTNGLWTVHVAAKDRVYPIVGTSLTSLGDAMEKALKILLAVQENPVRRARPAVTRLYDADITAMRKMS